LEGSSPSAGSPSSEPMKDHQHGTKYDDRIACDSGVMAHLKSEAPVKIPEPFYQEILSILDKDPRGFLLGGGLRKPHLPIFGAFKIGPLVPLLHFRI
jgi:hypothetical protein